MPGASALVVHVGDERFRGRLVSRDPRVDVRDFGARGDGATDCTQAFRLAAAEAARRGVPLYVPQGVWVLRGRVSVAPTATDPYGFPSFAVFGDGPAATTILIDDFAGFTPPDAVFDVTTANASIEIFDLTINTNFLAPPDAGLHIVRCSGAPALMMRDVSVFGDSGAPTNVSSILYVPTASTVPPSVAIFGSQDRNAYAFVFWPRILGGASIPRYVAVLVDVSLLTQPIAFGPDGSGKPILASSMLLVGVLSDELDLRSDLATPTIYIAGSELGLTLRSGTAVASSSRLVPLSVTADTTTPARLYASACSVEGSLTLSSPGGGEVRVFLGDSQVLMTTAPSINAGTVLSLSNCLYSAPAPTGTGRVVRDGWLMASVAWDPPALNAGQYTTVVVSVPGAQLGKAAHAAHSAALPNGTFLSAAVTGANTVTVTLWNFSASVVDVPAGTLTVWVRET